MLEKNDYLTPREIVAALDKYIIGQKEAKKKRGYCIAQPLAAYECDR